MNFTTRLFYFLSLFLIISCSKKETTPTKKGNELLAETSPYLLQHAYNPVHWKAWNDKTLNLAKKENKLIIISIGYSACHWFAIDPAFETLIVYRELYLTKHTGRDLAKAILRSERGELIDYGVLDSSCWHNRGQI